MIWSDLLQLITHLVYPLAITIIVECGLALAIFRRGKYAYYVLLLNILTNPLINFIMLLYFTYAGGNGYYAVLYVLEIAVVITEGLIFAKLTDRKVYEALIVSLLLNAASYLVGVRIL